MNTSRAMIAFLMVCVACQTKSGKEAATGQADSQPDSSAILARRPGPDAPRTAADRLVRALYFEHNKTGNPFREQTNRALIDQFFAKSTADLIWKAAQQKTGKAMAATNLLFGAPDAAIHKIWVEPAAAAGTRAVVYVTFLNKTKAEEIRLELQQVAGRWRIADMRYPNGRLLTQLMAA